MLEQIPGTRRPNTPATCTTRFFVCAFVTPNAGRASTLGLSRSVRDTVGQQEQRDSLARQMGRGFNELRRASGRP